MKEILWVDNDPGQIAPYVRALRDEGFHVVTAKTLTQAKQAVLESINWALAIVDVMIPTISAAEEAEFVDDTDRSFHTGMALARWIRRERPQLPVIGLSVAMDRELREWFARNCSGFALNTSLTLLQLFPGMRCVGSSCEERDPSSGSPAPGGAGATGRP